MPHVTVSEYDLSDCNNFTLFYSIILFMYLFPSRRYVKLCAGYFQLFYCHLLEHIKSVHSDNVLMWCSAYSVFVVIF